MTRCEEFDPCVVLDVRSDASDEEVRQAYLNAVKRHPPDRDPEGFSRVRSAYEMVKTAEDRIEWRLGWRDPSREDPVQVLESLKAIRTPVGPAPWLALISAATDRSSRGPT